MSDEKAKYAADLIYDWFRFTMGDHDPFPLLEKTFEVMSYGNVSIEDMLKEVRLRVISRTPY